MKNNDTHNQNPDTQPEKNPSSGIFNTSSVFGGEAITLTDRSLEEVAQLCQFFEPKIVSELPAGSVVVDAGSGTNQLFLHQALEINPGIIPVGIDMSLSISDSDITSGRVQLAETTFPDRQRVVVYFLKGNKPPSIPDSDVLDSEAGLNLHKNRIDTGKEVNTFSAYAPEIGIAPSSVTLYVDMAGPALYIENSYEKAHYLLNVSKILKPGGVAYIFPLYRGEFYWDDEMGPDITDDYDLANIIMDENPRVVVKVIHTYNTRKKYNTGLIIEKMEEGKDRESNRFVLLSYLKKT